MAQARKRGGIFASFGFQVLAGMALGLGLGLLARELGSEVGQAGHGLSEALRLAGSTFVQLLRVLVPPLVFTAIVASIANLRQLQNAAALVWRTLLGFAATALIAVSIGIVLGLVSGFLLYRAVVVPLQNVKHDIERMSAGDLSAKIDANGDDELAQMIQSHSAKYVYAMNFTRFSNR